MDSLLKQEEEYWQQRSRAIWFKERDKNTEFFHRKTFQRKASNSITKIQDDEGNVCFKPDQIEDILIKFYEDLFQTFAPQN